MKRLGAVATLLLGLSVGCETGGVVIRGGGPPPPLPPPPVVVPLPAPRTLWAKEIRAEHVRAQAIYAREVEAAHVRAGQVVRVRERDAKGWGGEEKIRATVVAADEIYARKIRARVVEAGVLYVHDLKREDDD